MGIAVGVGVFVAALAGIIVFILMRRYTLFPRSTKRRSTDTESRSQSPRLFHTKLGRRRSGRKVRRDSSAKGKKQSTVPEEEGMIPFIDLDRDLPQPASEGDLRRGWENLSVSIKNHVTDCYHLDEVSQDYHVDKSSPLAYLVPSLLENPKSRRLAIRQCIGKSIVENIQPDGNPENTFLPPKLVSIIHSMPITASEKAPRKFFSACDMAHSCANLPSKVLEAALARWRVITSFLLFPERGQVSEEYMVNSDIIKRAAEKLSTDLQPYLRPTRHISEKECQESLEKTLRLGAMFGLKLFSQGARWSFGEWDKGEKTEMKSGRRILLVSPALLKVTGENGQFFADPIVVHGETYGEF